MKHSPSVQVENASVSPGGEARVTVSVANVTEAKMRLPSAKWAIEYEKISPPPRITRQSKPPIWEWESPQPEITIEASFHPPDEAPQGEYYYSVAVRNCEEDNEWIGDAGIIELVESSNGE